jgi:CubicO group peptidase (beta-lactamase class C family)
MPTKDISALATDYPGTDTSKFGADITPAHMTAYGYVIDGTHYRGGYVTRFGNYPFKDVMAFPSYSTSKTMFTSLAAMRLAKKYPSLNVYNNNINALVPSCPAAKWSDVTISNGVDMATGNYGLTGFESDEGSTAMSNNYFLVESQAGRLDFMCNNYARKATPGTFWVYHTPDNALVATALQAVVVAQEPATATIDKFMTNEIFAPLGLSSMTFGVKKTYDTTAQAWGGYGMFINGDDYAKMGAFMNEGEGKIAGTQILDYSRLKMAMQRDAANPGLTVTVPSQPYNHRYKGNLWAKDMYGGAYASCGVTYTPYMSGFGGISVVLIKNKSTYYVVSDNLEYEWVTAVTEASAHVRSPCATTPYSA